MSLFTTFYSYKGGVGRSLALANVAWLLANHHTEPVRVLVIDFDLGAPGLHRVLGMKNVEKSLGILDYVHSFVDTAVVPDVAAHIHSTSCKGVDIIPAGKLDDEYQRRLEKVNWSELYEHRFGFELFQNLRKAISEQGYEYVLIDSLTGFSDVGGICVRQLPDALVLLFRLNQQNLDGIATVFDSTRKSGGVEGGIKSVIPVITPAWPFIDNTSTGWLKKAQKIFRGSELSEISFDGGLSFGEDIVSKRTKQMRSRYLKPKILEDYEGLTLRIRNLNPDDPLTIWSNLQTSRFSGSSDTNAQLYLTLLKMRPNSLEYWQLFQSIFFDLPKSARKKEPSSIAKELIIFLNSECDKPNSLALYSRALLSQFPLLASDIGDPLDDLNRALELNPKFDLARFRRAQVYAQSNQLSLAIADYQTLLDPRARRHSALHIIYFELGKLQLRNLNIGEARKYLMLALDSSPSSWNLLHSLAKLNYFEGNYEEALAFTQQALDVQPEHEVTRLLNAQICAAAGDSEQCEKILKDIVESDSISSHANVAEAYLTISPETAISILKTSRDDVDSAVSQILMRVARIFLGKSFSSRETDLANRDEPLELLDSSWDNFEVIAMAKWKYEQRYIDREIAGEALNLVMTNSQRHNFTL
jgi:MinD-like ATPase involved in chromosome partitioning or flagellar assembly/tetratricopeptide (TPR) repeat protein